MTRATNVAGPAHRPRRAHAASRSRGRRVVGALALLGLLGVGAAGAAWTQGYRVYVVHTGSMEPTLVPGDIVIDRPAAGTPRVGQVITFRHSGLAYDLVTHRVAGVTTAGIRTKGDANRSADAWTIRPDQVRGTVRFHLHALGYVAVYLQQPAGLASLAAAACALLLLWSLFFPGRDPAYSGAAGTPDQRPHWRDGGHAVRPRTS